MRRNWLITAGALVVLAALAYLGGAAGVGRALLPQWRNETVPLVLRFDEVRPMDVGTIVACRGVTIGRVSEQPYLDGEEVAVPVRIEKRHWSRLNESTSFVLATRNYLTQEQVIEAATPAASAPPLEPGAVRRGRMVEPIAALREAIKDFRVDVRIPGLSSGEAPAATAGEVDRDAPTLDGLVIEQLRISPTNLDGRAWDIEPGFSEPDVFVEVRQSGRLLHATPTARDTLEPVYDEPLWLTPPAVVSSESTLDVYVYDNDYLSYNDTIARFTLTRSQLARLLAGETLNLRGGGVEALVLRAMPKQGE